MDQIDQTDQMDSIFLHSNLTCRMVNSVTLTMRLLRSQENFKSVR